MYLNYTDILNCTRICRLWGNRLRAGMRLHYIMSTPNTYLNFYLLNRMDHHGVIKLNGEFVAW